VALRLGVRIVISTARTAAEIEPASARIAEQKVGGILVADDPFLQSERQNIVRLADRHALPAVYFSRDFVDAGGLISYGPSIIDAYRLVGVYTGRVLKGEAPADLPVVQPTKFETIINLKTARALGLALPQSLLLRADEVIE
jgi:putative ABC transport system substrate-binding protein